MFGSGAATLIFSNEEINDKMKTFKSLQESGLLTKGVSETIKNEAKEQKRGFLGMLFDPLVASLLGNLLSEKGKIWPGERAVATSQGQGTTRVRSGFLMPPHLLTSFEIQKYYEKEPRFNGVSQEVIYLK